RSNNLFGYIKPFKPQMRICEYDTYKAVYCGLCKQLGHSYGIAARFTLSYDFAFLSLLDMSLLDELPKFCKERCFANPLKKRYCCKSDEASRLSACTAMVMLYYKAEDNYRDLGFWGKALMLFIKPFTSAALRKAKTEYPVLDEIVADMIKKQLVIEENGCKNIDEAAEPTAICLSKIFLLLSTKENECRVLQRMGYLLGRWIYLIDAVDDLDDDKKSGNYNVFLMQAEDSASDKLSSAIQSATYTLNQTAAEIAKAYELLELKRYKTILDNIIYLGLKNSLNLVDEKRSLRK
ncbi:MAG: DUF5685 family protein, partial [Hydrogenoanaerobacterium sp.]